MRAMNIIPVAAGVVLAGALAWPAASVEIQIVSPRADQAVTIGSLFEVKLWVSEPVLLTPEASVDSGVNWFGLFPPDFMGCIDAQDTTTWIWNVNQADLKPGPVRFRVIGYSLPGIEEVSDYFVLAPAGAAARPRRDGDRGGGAAGFAADAFRGACSLDGRLMAPCVAGARPARRVSLREPGHVVRAVIAGTMFRTRHVQSPGADSGFRY